MRLILKEGIDKLKFGMTRADCCEILGKPDREIENLEEKNLEYNESKLRLTYYLNEGSRLGYIRTSNPNLVFKNQKIINSKIGFVIDSVFKPKISKWEKEEYDFFTTYFNEDNWITLVVEYGEVTEVEIGVPFKNDKNYDWPDEYKV